MMKTKSQHISRLLLAMLLLLGALSAGAQETRYTLTNGALDYFYGNQGDPDEGHRYDRAYNRANSWAEIHPYGNENISMLVEKGNVYAALDITDPDNPELVVKTVFDTMCVWSRTDNTGYYYQLHNGFRYYLVGSRAEGARIVRFADAMPIDNVSMWYDWDFGAAVQEERNNGQTKEYFWFTFDGTIWTMSCNSYNRPEDIIYSSWDISTPEENELNKSYNCSKEVTDGEGHVTGVEPASNGALFLPVEVTYYDRVITSMSGDQGLHGVTLTNHSGNDTMRFDTEDSVMRVKVNITTNASKKVNMRYIPEYSKYVEETKRVGINTDWHQRNEDGWGYAGVPTKVARYYWDDGNVDHIRVLKPNPPSERGGDTRIHAINYTLSNPSLRHLELEFTDDSTVVNLHLVTYPVRKTTGELYVEVYYDNGTVQRDTVIIQLTNKLAEQPVKEPISAPVVRGSVFGGGRMANVGGNTNVTVHSADSIYALYGGNDIAGWVQGDKGANIQIGTEHTDEDHPVHIGWVYGGGCGYYTYQGINRGYDVSTETYYDPYVFANSTALMYQAYYFNGKVYKWNTLPDDYSSHCADADATAGAAWNPADLVDTHTFKYTPYYIGKSLDDRPDQVDQSEDGNGWYEGDDGTIPYIKTAHITVGVPETEGHNDVGGHSAHHHNDYILIDSLFGGAENAFLGVDANEDFNTSNAISVDINGGTIYTVFGGNNYGGSVAHKSTVFVNVNGTKLQQDDEDVENTYFTGYGRDFGIRYLYGGGNLVEGNHASVNIYGGMTDTIFLGGNHASVINPIGMVQCEGDHFIHTNSTFDTTGFSTLDPEQWRFGPEYFITETGKYNVRCLFGGNNQAAMENIALIQLHSGGIGTVYAGGNMGDMNNSTSLTIPLYTELMARAFSNSGLRPTTRIGSIVSSLHDSKILCDYVFGGCRQGNVKYSCGVYIAGGVFGYINGGNDVSGDVGSTTAEGAYVILDSNVFVLGDVVAGSDGFYHCDDGTGHYGKASLYDTYSGDNYDPYDATVGLLLPTHNNTNVSMKNGTVLGMVLGGGVHANVGFDGNGDHIYIDGTERPIDLSAVDGSRHGEIHLNLTGGHIYGNVVGGGFMCSVYGLAYLHIGGDITIDGSVFAGNDLTGSIESFGAYHGGIDPTHGWWVIGNRDSVAFESYKSSNGDALNFREEDKSYNALYSSYLLIDGSPTITTVYGSGNGAYNYYNDRPEYPTPTYCKKTGSVDQPLQSSTYIDIHTSGGWIDTVFGGGNGVGVRDRVKLLLNNTATANNDHPDDYAFVGTIFGGNNRDNMMRCVPEVILLQGRVNNVFGGCNNGIMGYTGKNLTDACGNEVVGVSSYVQLTSDKVTVNDTVFGGCRMADVEGMAYVDIRNSSVDGVNYVYGGNDIGGVVKGNTRVDISGGMVNHIFGGSHGRYDYYEIDQNKYLIYPFHTPVSDTAGKLIVVSTKPTVDSTSVNIFGGTVNRSLYGGGSMADCRATQVLVDDQAGCGSNPAELHAVVYGGGEGFYSDLLETHRGNVTENTHVILKHATTVSEAKAYGGGRGGDVYNSTITLYPQWDQPFDAIYGGCWGSDVRHTAKLVLNGVTDGSNYTAENVFGGNDFTGNVFESRIVVNSGRYGNIYGAGNGDYIAHGSYDTGAYAATGKHLRVPNSNSVVIDFNNGYVAGNMYGGGKLGTTFDLVKDPETPSGYKVDSYGFYIPDTTRSVGGEATDYSYVLVNVHGGTFAQNIYAGGAGNDTCGLMIYGLKMLNMDGGTVNESVYGGSEKVSDGYPAECKSKTNTTKRPSSVLNLAGGVVKNNVYGAGYLGVVHGSAYVNVGLAAINECPVWDATISGNDNAYAQFKPGAANGYVPALTAKELMLESSIYSGANWGDNAGSPDFTKQGFYGGESRLIVDGNNYNTFLNENQENKPRMNIEKSLFGSGTSAEGGDINRRIDLRNYGELDPDNDCNPSCDLMSIQRTDELWLNNTVVRYTGASDAISAYYSDNFSFNHINTFNCVGYNVIDIDATATNIGEANFYKMAAFPYNNLTLVSPEETALCFENDSIYGCPSCSSDPNLCTQLNYLNRDVAENAFSAWVMNNGINVDFIGDDGSYSKIFGFAYIIAEANTNAMITALAKYVEDDYEYYDYDGDNMNEMAQAALDNSDADDEGFGHYVDSEREEEYGGFLSICSDKLKAIVPGESNGIDIQWCDCVLANEYTTVDTDVQDYCFTQMQGSNSEYPYTNFGTKSRVWSIGQGIRRRTAVIQAHSNPDTLRSDNKILVEDNSVPYTMSLAKGRLILPFTNPGHYYEIASEVVIADENGEVVLVDKSWAPSTFDTTRNAAGSWDDPAEGRWVASSASPSMGAAEIKANPNNYFGLVMIPSDNFARDGNGALQKPSVAGPTWDSVTAIVGDDHFSEASYYSPIVGNESTPPVLDFYMLYNNNFNRTVIATVTFTLNEYDAEGNDIHFPIEVQLSLSTILQEFQDAEYEVLAMYNEGRSNMFSRRAVLPATLQHRELYLEAIEWAPTDTTVGVHEGNGDWITTTQSPTPDYFYLTSDSASIISAAKNNLFRLTLLPVDNISNTSVSVIGWHERTVREPLDLFTAAGKSSAKEMVSAGSYYDHDSISLVSGVRPHGVKIGELDGRGEASLNITLNFDGNKVYDRVNGRGYIGKAVLTLVSYVGNDYSTQNRFQVTVDVKSRERGDTIYVASAPTLSRGGRTLTGNSTTEPHGYDIKDLGKSPAAYLKNFKEAFKKPIYQEGDVIAVLDTVVISGDNNKIFVKGDEYSPVQVIRYSGHHSEFPGEQCVYRGTMFAVRDHAQFTARLIVFKGSIVSKIIPGQGDDATWVSNHVLVYDRVTDLSDKYADTNMAYGPVISVSDNATVTLQQGIAVEENWNGYTGNDTKRYGAVNVGEGGVLRLLNNITIENNFSAKHPNPSAPTKVHPLNGAVYVNGGRLELLESNNNTAFDIQNNYRYDDPSSVQVWKDYTAMVASSEKLIRWEIDDTKMTDFHKANVFLTRTPTTEEGKDVDLYDNQSDVIVFSKAISAATRIGVSKWFPDDDEMKRDTIGIAFQNAATAVKQAYDNGNFISDDGYFTFFDYGVNNKRIYLQRCATFQFQQAGGAELIASSGILPDDALEYVALDESSCPIGGDQIIFRVHGGFFPYTYTWTNINTNSTEVLRSHTTAYTNNEMKRLIAESNYAPYVESIADTFVTGQVDMTPQKLSETIKFTVTADDNTGHCTLTKNLKITLRKRNVDIESFQQFEKTHVSPIDQYWVDADNNAWNDIHNPGDTARADRNYKAVHITPKVWVDRSAGTIIAQIANNDTIYIEDEEGHHPINDMLFCEGDLLTLATAPRRDGSGNPTNKFLMWDFDPFYNNPAKYVVPAHNTEVVAYYGPLTHWNDYVNNTSVAKAAYDGNYYYTNRNGNGYVTTYNGDVHIYDENGLAWFISVVNGLNGQQARPFYFNRVFLHKKDGGYDMKSYLWTPVGTLQHRFRGWLIGVDNSSDSCTVPLTDERVIIKNLFVDEPDRNHAGFFAFLDSAYVSGIELQGAFVHGGQYVGGIAAKSVGSTFNNCAVSDSIEGASTTSILSTRYVSGGLIGLSEKDVVTNSSAKAKYVGSAVYSGGMAGYATSSEFCDGYAYNDNRMNGLYIGGLVGYSTGEAPSTLRLFSSKSRSRYTHLANNYVHIANNGHPQRMGGLVGYADNTLIENNYVYGNVIGTTTDGAIAANMNRNAVANHNYYASDAASRSAGIINSNASIENDASFSGSGNQVTIDKEVYGVNNLTRVLNVWVREQNAGGANHKTWRSDLEGYNNGYPHFGQPDLIPVNGSATVEGCETVVVNGVTYTADSTVNFHIIDSVQMIDSSVTTLIRIHYGTRTELSDTATIGEDYWGHGFMVSAAESMLLRRTIDSIGYANIVLNDTLSTEYGCDSIVSLTLTFRGNVDLDDVEQNNSVNVYPNPTSNIVNVAAEGMIHVEFYDNEGRKLQDYDSHGQNSITFSVAKYASGIYYLRIHTLQGVTIIKLIKR